ncbi:MAG: DUF2914 domain-containing protein [Polyangiaceae bacterium]|nr:DUF2914 domain-containing protein [Polyangiaceae bacterium]
MATTPVIPIVSFVSALALLGGCDRVRERAEPERIASVTPEQAPPLSRGKALEVPGAPAPESPASPPQPDKASGDDDEPADEPAAAPETKVPTRDRGEPEHGTGKGRHRAKSSAHHKAASSDDDDPAEPAAVDAKLRLKRLVLSHRVEGREPVGSATSFSAGDAEVYAFVELDNAPRKATEIRVTFVSPKGASTTVKLKVGDVPRWRTWAKRTAAKAPGTWHVVVRDEDGKELGRTSFEVKS